MAFISEFKELGRSIISWIYFWIIGFVVFFLFGFKSVVIFHREVILPLPTINSFSLEFLKIIQKDLLPQGVKLIVTDPLSAFLTQVFIAGFLAFIITLPIFLYKFILYLSPALYLKEKKALAKILVPSLVLFVGGCVFSYFLIVPLTLSILYNYTFASGALAFFSLNEFVKIVFCLILAVGTIFLLPIFMGFLNYLGIANRKIWLSKWRYAVLAFVIFSAIITPDGTGVTMIILTIPMVVLYFLGASLSFRKTKKVESINK
ncbi:MAG: twin-arginine translocase subunit TatC [Candidatus Paceibacterota bacterium]|jgi:sec-independent protein translocase protein TatC